MERLFEHMGNQIKHYAYQATMQETLKDMGYSADMMRFYSDENRGKAFGIMEMLKYATNENADKIYTDAVAAAIEEAARALDTLKVNDYIIFLLDGAGFSGAEYHKVEGPRYWADLSAS